MTYRTAHERLWDRVDKSNGPDACWEWQGAVNSHGYGTIRQRCLSRGCHVIAFETQHGPVPKGALICHTCDNRKCCNPAHLYAGDATTNARDREVRCRSNHQRGVATGHAKITAAVAALIRYLAACGVRQNKLADLFGLQKMSVSLIARRINWAWVPDLQTPEALQ